MGGEIHGYGTPLIWSTMTILDKDTDGSISGSGRMGRESVLYALEYESQVLNVVLNGRFL